VAEMAGKYPAQRFVIINKADLNYEVSDQIEKWCIRQKIPMAGKLPFDEAVVKAMVNQQTIVEWAPEGETSMKIAEIWEAINNN
jgi:MinD superfamily P-loop ATPase